MHVSGEFDPEHCPMLVDIGKEVCETCGLKMCRLIDVIKEVQEEVKSKDVHANEELCTECRRTYPTDSSGHTPCDD